MPASRTAQMAGKSVLITGATSGIGLEAAVSLAQMGGRVFMVGRDPKKTTERLAEVRARSSNSAVELLLCDMASLARVRQLARDVLARCDRLDVLVNNAGSVYVERTLTEEGLESTFAVNYLSAFLLTNLLLDLLRKNAPARVVNVSSSGHFRGTMDFEDLGFEQGYQIMRAYSRSKLALVLFTRELARRLAGSGVTVNALHPGAVATNIWNRAPAAARPIFAVLKRVAMISPAAGAESIVYLATSPELRDTTGLYFDRTVAKAPSRLARDDALASRLWDESLRLTKLPSTT